MDILTYFKAVSDCYGSFWVVRLGVISVFSFIVFYTLQVHFDKIKYEVVLKTIFKYRYLAKWLLLLLI